MAQPPTLLVLPWWGLFCTGLPQGNTCMKQVPLRPLNAGWFLPINIPEEMQVTFFYIALCCFLHEAQESWKHSICLGYSRKTSAFAFDIPKAATKLTAYLTHHESLDCSFLNII